MYRLGRHWGTIQAYLISGIEDAIGELGEDLKRFAQTCELLINDAMFAKYRWCGNGRPPHSRVSLFKAYILQASDVAVALANAIADCHDWDSVAYCRRHHDRFRTAGDSDTRYRCFAIVDGILPRISIDCLELCASSKAYCHRSYGNRQFVRQGREGPL